MKEYRGLAALLFLFLLLCSIYNVSIPLFESPDEFAHFHYVTWFKTEKKLPHIIADSPTTGHEVFQPPLYYLLMAPVTAVINTDDLYDVAPLNEDWFNGAGINVHYHSAAEAFPYRDTALAVHIVRFLSSVLACITLVSTYGIARLIIPQQALLATAVVAFNPMFIFLSAVVNNDTLIIAISTLTIWWLVKLLFSSSIPGWHYLLLGLLWGFAILSKASGLALGGVIVLGLVFSAWHYHAWKSRAIGLLFVFLGTFLSAGWWFIRNILLYQEPLAWDAVLFANRNLLRNTQLSLADMYHYAGGLLDTYWVSFGYGALTAPAVFYSLINWLLVVSLVGVGIWIFQNSKRRPLPVQLLSVVLLIVWNGLLFVSLLQWMRLLQETNQGRLLFPGIGAVAVLIVVGFSALLSGRRNWLGLGFVSLLGVLAVLAPFMLIKPAYAQPTSVLMVSDIPNPVNVTFGDHIELLGYALSETAVSPGDSLAVDLYWNTDAVLSENYAVSLHVLDPSGEVASRLNVLPYNGRYATPVWRPDFPFKDTYTMPPINEGAIPGRGHLIVSLYPWGAHQEPLPVVVDDIPIGAIHTIAPLKIASGVTAVYDDMASKTDIIFGEKIKLLGFDAPGNLVPAQTYPITLFWEALQPDGVDYTVFVHLVDSQGQVVAQADSPPQNNRFPTSIWAKNEQIVDVHTLVLPEDLASGFYDLFVGLYDPNTGQRLTAVASDGTPSPENSFLLTTKSTE